jgi:hypothetical protein
MACGILGMLMPVVFGLWSGIPEPAVHDEFVYLLGADTFAHGRMTNPAPQLPEFFESPHLLVTPSYASKYPPAQSIALAIGQVLGGHPIWGVWLSCGLFAAALCWMLQSWVSPRWALAVTIVAIMTRGISSYWAQSYWGGMVAAMGAALVLGAVHRTLRAPSVITSVLMGLGLVILANSRPFEGAILAVVVMPLLTWWLVASGRVPFRVKLLRCVIPCAAVLVAGGLWMALYNRAVTSSALLQPYEAHNAQYFGQGPFIFSELYEPERQPHPRVAEVYDIQRHPTARGAVLASEFFRNFLSRSQRSLEAAFTLTSSGDYEGEVKKSILWLALLVMVPMLSSRWALFCGVAFLAVSAGGAVTRWWFPHYSAPAVPLVLALVATGLRQMSLPGGRRGRATLAPFAVATLAFAAVSLPAVRVIGAGRPGPGERAPTMNREYVDPIRARARALAQLDREPGKKLVFVNVTSDAKHYEWVYNPADLEAANVLFVHDLGDVKNRQLIALWPDRTPWIARLGNHNEVTLARYSRAEPD